MTDLLTPQPPPTNEAGDLWSDLERGALRELIAMQAGK